MGKINTDRLLLLPATTTMLEAGIASNEELAALLNVRVEEDWLAFGKGSLEFVLKRLRSKTWELGWWNYFVILKSENKLIGNCGFKGPPSRDGEVELGYELAEKYRGKGLATEFVNGLINHAFLDPKVKAVSAHTLAEKNASTRVLEKCRMVMTREINDPVDGLIWRWEMAVFDS